MSCIDILYSGERGLYCAVHPISDVTVPVVTSPEAMEWDPVAADEYHATVAFNRDVAVSRERLEAWIDANRLTKSMVYTAASLGAPQWWENGGKVYLGLELYSPALFGIHEAFKGLGVSSSFPTYKCHLTYGCWRGIPANLVADRLFMNNFVKTMVSVQTPNIIDFSLMRISDAAD